MTDNVFRVDYPARSRWKNGNGLRAAEHEIARPSAERTRALSEVGSAIVHQLNGPLTALRLYIGEIRENGGLSRESAEAQESLQQLVEGAFQETERICAMMRLITDTFEEPLYPESAAALGRDVITWWSRSADASERDPERAVSIHDLLTPREREVLGLISRGCSNKQGAIVLQIGPRTFESHRARIMRKLGAKNAADLVRMALGEFR